MTFTPTIPSRDATPPDGGPTRALNRGMRVGPYELLAPLGEGGMATVWLARRVTTLGFSRVIALKAMQPGFSGKPDYRRMFLDEAAIAARLHHPNVGAVYDLIEDGGRLFIGLEWIEGESLSTLFDRELARKELIPLGVALRIVADASAGLHAVHELRDEDGALLQAVHRDVSPHNIVVGLTGITKIIDFGIAKSKERLAKETALGVVKGKIRYLAPEQARAEAIDRRADIWAMGAVLYRVLTGRFRFEGDDRQVLLDLISSAPKAAPLPARIPVAVRDVVNRALSSEKQARFETALQLRDALEDAMRTSNLITLTSDVERYLGGPAGECIRERRRVFTLAMQAQIEAPKPVGAHDATIPISLIDLQFATKLDSPVAFRALNAQTMLSGSGRDLRLPTPSKQNVIRLGRSPVASQKKKEDTKKSKRVGGWSYQLPRAVAAWAVSVAATMVVVVESSRISNRAAHADASPAADTTQIAAPPARASIARPLPSSSSHPRESHDGGVPPSH